MKGFAGFPAGKQSLTSVPSLFFTELLPAIDHLGELKVTLHIVWLLAHKRSEQRYVSHTELASDRRLLAGLSVPGMRPEEALGDALDRAVARGTLLRVTVSQATNPDAWYFLNSEKGRQAVEGLLAGLWRPDGTDQAASFQAQRPNIFVLYEQNIGPLAPMLSQKLMEAEDSYPASWIEDAFREAVEMNKRSWRYIQAILERWAAEGRADEAPRRGDERDGRRFIEGPYADYIEH